MLIEPAADQVGQGVQGRLGVGSVGLELEPGAARGGERRQVEDTPAAHLAAVAGDLDIGSELLGQSYELLGGPEMEAERVGDLDLSAGLELRTSVAAHCLGWRPGLKGRLRFGVRRGEQRHQGIVVDGLEEMVIAPGRPRPSEILILAVPGDGDDDERPAHLLTEPGCDLITVQAGQADVEQDIVRSLASCDLDGLMPVQGDLHVVAEASEPNGHGLGGIRVVVDDQDLGHIDLANVSGYGRTQGADWAEDVPPPADKHPRLSAPTPQAVSSPIPCIPGPCEGAAEPGLTAPCAEESRLRHLTEIGYPLQLETAPTPRVLPDINGECDSLASRRIAVVVEGRRNVPSREFIAR